MKFFDCLWPGCAALAFALVLPAMAMAQSATGQTLEDTQSGKSGITQFNEPVSLVTLEDQRGGAQGMSSEMKLSGTTAGNLANEVVTGTNAISAGAFANMSGLPVVIQNSGANVLIQNAVILNLHMN